MPSSNFPPQSTLPTTIEEMTPEWLSVVLPGAAGSDVSAERIGEMDGFNGVLARLTPTYEHPNPALPQTLIAKIPDKEPEQRASQSEVFDIEVGFYRSFAEETAVDSEGSIQPHCYYSAAEPDEHNYVLLLEDLSHGRMSTFFEYTPIADGERIIDTLAQLHAPRWNSPELETFEWAVDGRDSNVWHDRQTAYVASWDKFCDSWGDLVEPGVREIAEAFGPKITEVMTVPEGAAVTLTHGDTHPGNLFLFDDVAKPGVRVIDWQRTAVQQGVWDVGNFFVFSLKPEDRRQEEMRLLERYLAGLQAGGVDDYTMEDLVEDYRRALLYPIIRMVPMGSKLSPGIPGARDAARKVFPKLIALEDWNCGDLF
jgi:hypothetical protein